MQKSYTQCQSCGMPLKKDPKGGGTEKDGKISKMYCGHCYKDGKFTRPELTLKDMQQRVNDILKKEMHRRRFFRRLAVMQIPRLTRWKK